MLPMGGQALVMKIRSSRAEKQYRLGNQRMRGGESAVRHSVIAIIVAVAVLPSLTFADCLLAGSGRVVFAGQPRTAEVVARGVNETEEVDEECPEEAEKHSEQGDRAEGKEVVDEDKPEKGGTSGEDEKPAEDKKSTSLETVKPREVPKRKLVESKRERKAFRMNMWVSGLEGDMERIHGEYGHPTGRHRDEVMGRIIEKWVYSDKGKTFIFEDNKLVDRH